MKPLHLPVTGHDLLAVERFQDDTRHMIEFLALEDSAFGQAGQYVRRFLTEDRYAGALEAQRRGVLLIRKHADIIEGHILPERKRKRRRR